MERRMKELLKVLITVKTYPIPSAKYGELVCTAGVTEDGQFIRLYPVNFRDQPYSKQYRKYQWIEVEAEHHTGRDFRKESYRPDCDTLTMLGEPIRSKGTWLGRSKYVLPVRSVSMEALKEQQLVDETSLGLIRPKVVHDLVIVATDRDWRPSFYQELKQARLWDDRTVSCEPPRKVPFTFKYVFECDDPRCKGHRMMNEDWEVGALYWRLIDGGATEAEAKEKVKQNFSTSCADPKKTHTSSSVLCSHIPRVGW
jgi:hypothetical protein